MRHGREDRWAGRRGRRAGEGDSPGDIFGVDARGDALGGCKDSLRGACQLRSELAQRLDERGIEAVGRDAAAGAEVLDRREHSLCAQRRGLEACAGLADNPAWLATAGSAATSIGGNENLLGLIALADAPIALGGTATAGQAVASIVADIGRAARSESDAAADASMQLEQNKALYQSETGVSIDEELIDLTRFERAYQAGARIIETVDRMFEAVLAI